MKTAITRENLLIHKRFLPPLGQRILKTGAAAFVLLLARMLTGYPTDAGSAIVTAIICMQPYSQDTWTNAVERVLGTFLGAVWALAFLLLMRQFPGLGTCQAGVYAIMAFFIILAIYSTVVMKISSTACLTAIVLISTIAAWPNVSEPVQQTVRSLIDTIMGTVAAIGINAFHLPRRKHPERLFFIRSMDLVPDRYRQIPSSVHITLDRLYQDGAKICIVSRWAPAFIISQMGLLHVNAPMIIMDGAALYDIGENKYMDVIPIPRENADRLRNILTGFGAGVNLYAVNEYTMTVCHDGPVNAEEKRERNEMKRSPYRHYADGLPREEDYIAFMRVIGPKAEIEALAYEVAGVLPTGMFRMAVRQDDKYPDASGLYFYDASATPEAMKQRVVKLMSGQAGMPLEPHELFPRTSRYLPEHDAMLLLGRLKNLYEPITLLPRPGKS